MSELSEGLYSQSWCYIGQNPSWGEKKKISVFPMEQPCKMWGWNQVGVTDPPLKPRGICLMVVIFLLGFGAVLWPTFSGRAGSCSSCLLTQIPPWFPRAAGSERPGEGLDEILFGVCLLSSPGTGGQSLPQNQPRAALTQGIQEIYLFIYFSPQQGEKAVCTRESICSSGYQLNPSGVFYLLFFC